MVLSTVEEGIIEVASSCAESKIYERKEQTSEANMATKETEGAKASLAISKLHKDTVAMVLFC